MWYPYDQIVDFHDALIGKTITDIQVSDDKRTVDIETEEGEKYRMFHQQDCCESVYLEDVVGELNSIVGSPLVKAEEVTKDGDPDYGSATWTFYHLTNQEGYDVTFRWYGSSNGYYSERVDLLHVNKEDDE